MQYRVHGKTVNVDGGECGIYRSAGILARPEYAVMDPTLLVERINDLPPDRVIDAVTLLRDLATEQAKRSRAPQNQGSPFLRQTGPAETPIESVREHIRSTERFCNAILEALQGK